MCPSSVRCSRFSPQQDTGSFCPADGSTWVTKKRDHYNFGDIAKEAGRASCPCRCPQRAGFCQWRRAISSLFTASGHVRSRKHRRFETPRPQGRSGTSFSVLRVGLVFSPEEPCLLCVAPRENHGIRSEFCLFHVFVLPRRILVTQNRFSRFSPSYMCSSVTFVPFFSGFDFVVEKQH